MLGQLGLDPLGADVAAPGGDVHGLAAALDVGEALVVDVAEVAGAQRPGRRRRLAGVAEEARAVDQQLAVGVHPQRGVAEHPAHAARPRGAGPVEADHRRALAQPVALEHRQAQRRGAGQQRGRHARAAHRDHPERAGQRGALLRRDHQRLQQLRHEDQRVGLVRAQRGDEARHVEPAAAAVAQRGQARQHDLAALQQRRVHAADGLQQHAQRQCAQVPAHAQRGHRLAQRRRHPRGERGVEAGALGQAGGAGGVGEQRGAGGHRARRRGQQAQRERAAGQRAQAGRGRGGQHQRDGGLERVRHLGVGEERRQRDVGAAQAKQGQLQHHRVRAVVEPAGDGAGRQRVERGGERLDATAQRGRVERAGVAAQHGVAAGAAIEGGEHGAHAPAPASVARGASRPAACAAAAASRKAAPAARSPHSSIGWVS